MKIDVSRLEQGPLEFAERMTLEPERLAGDLVASPVEVRLEGEVRPQGGAYSVTGRCRAAGELSCSRCLEPVAWEADERFSVEYRRPEGSGTEPELGLEEGFRLHPDDMEELGIKAGATLALRLNGAEVSAPAKADADCARGAIYVYRPQAYGGLAHRRGLEPLFRLEGAFASVSVARQGKAREPRALRQAASKS